MSWTSRFQNLGRFSPFTRAPHGSAPQVSDADFSYITADDLRQHQAASVSAALDERPTADGDDGPPRETDLIIVRNKKSDYALNFSAYSIAKGDLTIGKVREAAAKRLTNGDKARVKLLYRGRNLKDDARSCKQEGLKDGSEILCTIAEPTDPDNEDGSSSGDDDDAAAGGQQGEAKKRRNRGKKTKRRNKREAASVSGSSTPDRLAPNHPLSQASSRPQSPKVPQTAAEKLSALRDNLTSLQYEVDKYISNPPTEQKQRDFDYKRLSETILTQVLLKLDEIETEGDAEARSRRKELVKETQATLGRLDEVGKGSSL